MSLDPSSRIGANEDIALPLMAAIAAVMLWSLVLQCRSAIRSRRRDSVMTMWPPVGSAVRLGAVALMLGFVLSLTDVISGVRKTMDTGQTTAVWYLYVMIGCAHPLVWGAVMMLAGCLQDFCISILFRGNDPDKTLKGK